MTLASALLGTLVLLWCALMPWYHLQVLHITKPRPGLSNEWAVFGAAGAIHISAGWGNDLSGNPAGWKVDAFPRGDVASDPWIDGFWFYYQSFTVAGRRTDQAGLPCWAVVLLALPLPWLWLRRRYAQRRRRQRNLCVVCGYDLRATPDRCPECGAAPSAGLSSRV